MNGLPYYKRYPRDFVEGTIGLGLELKTAYAFILDLIYMQGGKLPDEPRYISGLLECSVRKWNSIRERLIEAGKIASVEGYLTNYRAVSELESLAKLQDKQRENRSRPNKIKEIESPPFNHTEPDTDTERNKKRARENALAASFDEFWNSWPNKVGKPAARKAWPRALAAAGSVDVINAGVRRYIAAKPPDRNWLNPATFLNQERWNDEPATTGDESGGYVELPKWKGPEDDAETQGILRKGSTVHQGEEDGGLRSLPGNISGNGGMERMGRLLS